MTELTKKMLDRLDQQLPGRISRPGDERYMEATRIWAKPVGRTPRAIVHCRTTEDVKMAVRSARNLDLPLSVRGGGHDWAGRALCDGIVIDLSGMKGVVADFEKHESFVSGGARVADVVAVTDPLGLVPVTGSVGAVGMAGLALGGGYGPLIGRFGLALDNLLAAEVVLADGSIAVADPVSEPDLFWAIRGGGGNFGVVTAMRHRLHELTSVRAGMLLYPFSEAKTVLQGYADLSASAPDELTAQLGFAFGANGAPILMIVPTWCGLPEEGEAAVAPFFQLGTVVTHTIAVIPYGAMLAIFDPFLVNGRRTIMETCWLPVLDRAGVDILIEAMANAVSPGCAIFTHEFRGAASRVPARTTAFGLRRDHVLIEVLTSLVDGSGELEEERHREWARATRLAFDGMALAGGYPNLLSEGDVDRAARSYGDNAARLIQAKRHYDPDNVFRSAIPLPRRQDDVQRSERAQSSAGSAQRP
jgi:FAD/FMN-containing dehydrogenase